MFAIDVTVHSANRDTFVCSGNLYQLTEKICVKYTTRRDLRYKRPECSFGPWIT